NLPQTEHPTLHIHARFTTNPARGAQRLKHTDWFNLGITVRVENHTITFTELFRALATGETHIMLPNGAWFPLDLPELTQLRTLIDESRHLIDPDRTTLHITPAHLGLYEHLTALGIITHEATTWRERINTLTTPHTTPQLPATLHANLRPYQIHGYTWMRRLWNAKLGGILADDMGLGKTLQVLAAAAAAHDNGELDNNPLLVIAPTSVVNTWVNEATTFTPDLRITTLTTTTGKSKHTITDRIADAHLVITTYTIARIDEKEFAQIPWSGMILDEAHIAKNHQSKTYSALRHIKAPIRFAITGTPVENSLMDLWALLSITSPGLLPDPATFTDTYRRPIEEGTDPTRAEHLLKRISPMLLRRTKEDVAADLPPKQEQTVRVALAPAHRRAYDTRLARERRRVLKLSEDMARNKVAIFSSLTMLRQLALAPALVAPDDPAMTSISSTKIDVLVDLLREVIDGGHRALVFSQFTRYLHMVQTRLRNEKITTTYLDGATRNRAAVIEEFREGDAPVFLISLKAGGVGLTLTEADYVFLMDPWWNPAAEQQAIDRTHRIGQHRQVMVYRLVATDTIEDKVIALGEHKRHIADTILNDPASLRGALTVEDLRNLLD
ncbi:DEAD/DEAH box helicase, partial [Dermatophilus congolensis]|uniref:DEAD/DEAH box helicase n=5 Tax=Dermatophilus congolensis TaxID=1863 RepID=UPI001AB0572E